jgi:hypothetical protein
MVAGDRTGMKKAADAALCEGNGGRFQSQSRR